MADAAGLVGIMPTLAVRHLPVQVLVLPVVTLSQLEKATVLLCT